MDGCSLLFAEVDNLLVEIYFHPLAQKGCSGYIVGELQATSEMI